MHESKNFFMDFETLGIRETSIILSMAVLAIPRYEILGEYHPLDLRKYGKVIYPDQDEQKKLGRTTDISTLDWWNRQNEEVRQKQLNQNGEAIPCRQAYDCLNQFLIDNQFNFDGGIMWSRGLFEGKLLESFCNSLGLTGKPLIPYYNWRDTRTACYVLCGSPDLRNQIERGQLNKHDPLDDCILDYRRLRMCFAKHKLSGLV